MTCADRLTPPPVSWLRRLAGRLSDPSGVSRDVSPAQRRLRAFYFHMALWTLQAWLAMFFVGAAYAKLTQSPEMLTHLLGWSEGVDPGLVRAVGGAELVLAVGVLAPLVTWRGGGQVMAFAVVGMIGLTAFTLALHLSRLEFGFATLNLALAGLALVVLVGRLRDARVSL